MTPRSADSWKSRLYDSYVSSGQSSYQKSGKNAPFAARAPYINRLITKYFDVPRETPIVDLGCGYGAFVHLLHERGYTNVSGVDVSVEQTELAIALGVEGITQTDVMSHLAATKSTSIGVILLMDILEHLTREELFATVDEVFRVLIPGGRCILHVPNAEGIFGMRIRYGDLTHELSFTASSARQLLRSAGFRLVSCYEERPVVHGIKSAGRRLLWDTATLVPRLLLAAETGDGAAILSQNMLVVADK